MKLNDDLITQFAKIAKNDNRKNDAATVRGTAKTSEGKTYIALDGADEGSMTPVDTTVEVADGDRVIAIIKDHGATITGNTSDPAVGVKTANGLKSTITQTAAEIRAEVENMASGLKSTFSQTATEIRAEVSNVQSGLDSKLTQTATEIRTEVSNVQSGLDSKLTQTATEIRTEVKAKDDEFSAFVQDVNGFAFMGNGGTVKISGGDVNLTGAISWSDLTSDTQQEISDAQDAADTAQDTADAAKKAANAAQNSADSAQSDADAAYELASTALSRAEANKLPSYIKSTYIASTEIRSPQIIGGEIYAVGSDPDTASVFAQMTDNGFFVYSYDVISNVDDTIDPKISLYTNSSGSRVKLILGAGSSSYSYVNSDRFIIQKVNDSTTIYYYNDGNAECGFELTSDLDIIVHANGTEFSISDLLNSSGSDPLDAWPVGSLYMSYDSTSPARTFGGSWMLLPGYFLYATGSTSAIGDTGWVVTDESNDSRAQYIKVAVWERVA